MWKGQLFFSKLILELSDDILASRKKGRGKCLFYKDRKILFSNPSPHPLFTTMLKRRTFSQFHEETSFKTTQRAPFPSPCLNHTKKNKQMNTTFAFSSLLFTKGSGGSGIFLLPSLDTLTLFNNQSRWIMAFEILNPLISFSNFLSWLLYVTFLG